MVATRATGIFDKAAPIPRRHRRLIIVLFAIITFLSILAWTNQRHLGEPTTTPPQEATHPTKRRTHVYNPPTSKPSLRLAPEQELAAIVSFLGHIQTNGGLPPTVNPNLPIEPQLVLGFDTTTDRAPAELRQLIEDTWASNPVVVFTESRSAASREVRDILSTYGLRPAPMVINVDERMDAQVLTPILHRLCLTKSLPILLVGGSSFTSLEQIRRLHQSGQLKTLVKAAGATVDGHKKHKRGHRR